MKMRLINTASNYALLSGRSMLKEKQEPRVVGGGPCGRLRGL